MYKTTHKFSSAAAAFAFCAFGLTNVIAAPLVYTGSGVVNVANATGGTVAVTSFPVPCISFAGASTCGTLSTTIVASEITEPIFGNSGTIKDIGTAFPIVGFKTVALTGGGTAIFDLTSIEPPSGFPACTTSTVSGSCSTDHFILSQVSPTQVSVTFTVNEIAYTGTSATGFTPYQGIFTTQIVNTTIGGIIALEATGGTIKSTWSGSESPLPHAPPPFTGCTVTQGGWGAPAHGNNPGAFLNANFPSAYPGGVQIGGAVNNLLFTSSTAVRNFLPQGGPPSFLTGGHLVNQTTSSAGVFGGQVLALQLNVDLEHLGSLVVTGTGTPFDGQTVAQVLAAANLALGGGALPPGFASYSALNDLIDQLNSSFDGCVADSWALAHLH